MSDDGAAIAGLGGVRFLEADEFGALAQRPVGGVGRLADHGMHVQLPKGARLGEPGRKTGARSVPVQRHGTERRAYCPRILACVLRFAFYN
jgi:hypothetical protein